MKAGPRNACLRLADPRLTGLLLTGLLLAALLLTGAAAAPEDGGAPEPPAVEDLDPFEAYEAGAWERAREGFLDRRVERPEDPATAYNLGSALYQLERYDEAARAFEAAAAAAGPEGLRRKALFALGNTSYRQGRWEEAEALYRRVLELDPGDLDAKHNLELVLRRMDQHRRRDRQRRGEGEDRGEGGQGRSAQGAAQGAAREAGAPSAPSPPVPEPLGEDTSTDAGDHPQRTAAAPPEGAAGGGDEEEMTLQEALRYLRMIEEPGPRQSRRGPRRPTPRTGKDW